MKNKPTLLIVEDDAENDRDYAKTAAKLGVDQRELEAASSRLGEIERQ